MRYLSVCSGIEAATVAWHPLGWEAAAFSEIEAFPRSVLSHHYPDTPLHGDFTTIGADDYGPIDLLVGGTPCQSFSIAGLRKGLADDRGNLALEYLRLADRKRARWLVWENVPGVLSSNSGRDFGAFLGALVELGYGFAYRVLDAQFFGVAQRRRRVFVVGYLGDWRRAAAVLFERHSLSGNPAPSRQAGQRVADTLAVGANQCSGFPSNFVEWPAQVAPTLYARMGDKMGLENQHIDSGAGHFVAHSLRGEGFDASEDGTGRGTPIVAIQERALSENPDAGPDGAGYRSDGAAYTLEARSVPQAVCFTAKDYGADASDIAPTLRSGNHSGSHANGGVMPAVAFSENQQGAVWEADTAQALNKGGGKPGQGYAAIRQAFAVRRLTPRECERLQGFPDDYTLVTHRGKPAADGPRYKALGNSMAVPVMAWIGQRIAQVEALNQQREAA